MRVDPDNEAVLLEGNGVFTVEAESHSMPEVKERWGRPVCM